jgi:threonine dehydrogenase-like Zn-dependent dehydrogenase
VRAVQFDPTVPRFLATRLFGAITPAAYLGPASPLRYGNVTEPRLPGDEWVRVQVSLGGICGSDLHLARLETSPLTSAYASFPFVPGHENVGTVVETGRAAGGVSVGQRVTVEPVLPCRARGIDPPCANCAAGDYNLCLRTTDGHLSPGLMIGACRDTGGSWGERFVAHRSQVLPVPDGVTDDEALLAEPMACAAHALLRHPPADGATVLVIGGGVIGQCVVAALRAIGTRARIIVLAKHDFQCAMAGQMGADEVVALGPDEAHVEAVAALTGGTVRRTLFGRRVLIGGADLTLECVGSSPSLNDALGLTRPGGRVVLLGLAATPRSVDWTPIWLKELQISGSYVYAWEGTATARAGRTMEIILGWMSAGKIRLSGLVTHRFPLHSYRKALAAAIGKARSGAFKVALQP